MAIDKVAVFFKGEKLPTVDMFDSLYCGLLMCLLVQREKSSWEEKRDSKRDDGLLDAPCGILYE